MFQFLCINASENLLTRRLAVSTNFLFLQFFFLPFLLNNQLAYYRHYYLQASNQEFFRAVEFFWNQGTLVNIIYNTRKKGSARKKFLFFFPEKLKNYILNYKFKPQMATIRAFSFQVIDNSDFKLEYVKIFLRKFC